MPEQQNTDLNELNKASYDKIAGEFSATRSYGWKDVEYLFKYVKSGDKILDAGCGNGRLLQNVPQQRDPLGTKYKMQNANYLGIDNSEGLINEARKKYPEFRFEVVDVTNGKNTNKIENKFDVVFCVSALNHFPKEKQNQVLQNFKEVLKSGGYLLMVNWNLWNVKNKKGIWRKCNANMRMHANNTNNTLKFKDVLTNWKSGATEAPLYYYAFTKKEVGSLMLENGFKVVENFYVKNGKRSSWLFGNNILTVGKLKK